MVIAWGRNYTKAREPEPLGVPGRSSAQFHQSSALFIFFLCLFGQAKNYQWIKYWDWTNGYYTRVYVLKLTIDIRLRDQISKASKNTLSSHANNIIILRTQRRARRRINFASVAIVAINDCNIFARWQDCSLKEKNLFADQNSSALLSATNKALAAAAAAVVLTTAHISTCSLMIWNEICVYTWSQASDLNWHNANINILFIQR